MLALAIAAIALISGILTLIVNAMQLLEEYRELRKNSKPIH